MVDNVKTYRQLREDANRELNELSDLIKGIETPLREKAIQDWIDNGGCTKCWGRGWVVTWDTSDSLSGCYAEYGECECPCDGRNPAPKHRTKYDIIRHTINTWEKHPAYLQLVAPLKQLLSSLEQKEIQLGYECEVKKEKEVVVSRGRKVPVGTQGRVIWKGYPKQNYGFGPPQLRVGLTTASGETFWTAASNVDVIVSS